MQKGLAWVATEGVLPVIFPLSFRHGHVEELWGLAAHPSRAQFVSSGQDKLVHLWSSETHQPVWSRSIEVWAGTQTQAAEKCRTALHRPARPCTARRPRAPTAPAEALSSVPSNHLGWLTAVWAGIRCPLLG